MNAAECPCGRPICTGPGGLAAMHLYQGQIRAERTADGRRFRSRRSDFQISRTVFYLVGHLEGDAPVRLNLGEMAELYDRSEALMLAELDWFAEHRFVHLDGRADGIVRLWVNPAVAVCGADPRIAAARHSFPYFTVEDASSEDRVCVHEYSEDLWEAIYAGNFEAFTRETFLSPDCRVCCSPRLTVV
ncbi:hypothetical protein [Kitasatospora sp. NPDC059803]|uniref:hypothetical protein n=2 Tax=unclassified Kitasatospora TaxID=2633591 RepID=UPI00366A210A